MAAVSQKVSRDEVMPLLARNVSVQGYQDGKPTEFLVLLRRYLDQARELGAGQSRENDQSFKLQ